MVVLVHREGEAVLTHLHALENGVELHARKQILKARRANAELHEAVGDTRIVVERHADVLAQLAGDLVGHRILDHAVNALEQLPELVALVGGVLAQHEVGVRGVGRGQRARAVEHVHVLDLQHVGELLQLLTRLERRVGVEDVGSHLGLVEVTLVVLLGERVGLVVGALDRRLDVGGAFLAAHRLSRQRKERLHVERHDDDGKEADERQNDGLAADRLVVAQRPDVDVVLGVVAALLVLAHDEQTVERHDHRSGEEHEQDHAHREVARRNELAFGHGGDVVGAVDFGHARIEALAVEFEPSEAAVLEL